MARKRKRDLKGTICLRRPIDGDIDSDVQIQQKNYEEPFAKLSKVDDFIPQKRVISGGFNPRHGHLTDVCWKSKTTTSRVRKKVNHAHYKSYTR